VWSAVSLVVVLLLVNLSAQHWQLGLTYIPDFRYGSNQMDYELYMFFEDGPHLKMTMSYTYPCEYTLNFKTTCGFMPIQTLM
jgi:hypothetical protein